MAYLNRFFSTTRTALIRYIGYNIESLTPDWAGDIINYTQNGAVKKVGPISTVEILYRPDKGPSPVHQSCYNTADKALCISLRITNNLGVTKTHHVYPGGVGTMKMGDVLE